MKFYALWKSYRKNHVNLNIKELFSIFEKKNSHFDIHKIIEKQVYK